MKPRQLDILEVGLRQCDHIDLLECSQELHLGEDGLLILSLQVENLIDERLLAHVESAVVVLL